MATLLDIINKKASLDLTQGVKQDAASQAIAKPTGVASTQTDFARQVLTGATGTAQQPPTLPTTPDVQAQAAKSLQDIQQRTLEQSAREQDKETENRVKEAAINLSNQELEKGTLQLKVRSQFTQQLNTILQEMEQNKERLETDMYKSRVQQAGFLLRLSNDKYINQMKLEGARARLDNEAKFKEAITKQIFEEELQIFKNDLSFKALLRQDQRDFERRVAEFNIDDALRIAQAEIDTAEDLTFYSGVSSLISGGAQTAEKILTKRPTPPEQPAVAQEDIYAVPANTTAYQPTATELR